MFFFFFFSFIFISWRLINLQYCSGFCHTLTWISYEFSCVPHPEPPPTSLPIPSPWVIPVHQPWAIVSCIHYTEWSKPERQRPVQYTNAYIWTSVLIRDTKERHEEESRSPEHWGKDPRDAHGTLLSVMQQPAWEGSLGRMDPCICMAKSLGCSPETIILLIGCGGGLAAKSCPTLATPWTVACQAPLSMGFSRQEYWSGCHFLLQGIFPTPGWNPGLCTVGRFFTNSHQGSPHLLSVQFSCSVVSDSVQPRGPQHARLSSSSPSPGACLNSCPSSRWCHSTISSSVIPFSSGLQSFPASESFPKCQFFTSGGQSIGASASAAVLPKNVQDFRISFRID